MAMKTFSEFNIEIPSGASGNIKTTCPKCSSNRKKSNEKCLSVQVDEGVWNCHHCGFSGGLNESKKTNDDKPKIYKNTWLGFITQAGVSLG